MEGATLTATATAHHRSYEVSCTGPGTGLVLNPMTRSPGETSTAFAVTFLPNLWQQEDAGKDIVLVVFACPADRREALRPAYDALLASLSFTGRYQAPPAPALAGAALWEGFLRVPGHRSLADSRRLSLAVGATENGLLIWRLPVPQDGAVVFVLLSPPGDKVWVLTAAQALATGTLRDGFLVLTSDTLRPYLSAWQNLLIPSG